MFRLLARTALLIAALAAGVLLLMRTQDYDDSPLKRLFDSCTTMPCWQGIHPGETTTADALAILRAHPWVASVTEVGASRYESGLQESLIYWTWSSSYPFAGGFPSPQQGIIVSDGGLVRQIYLTTSIPLGDVWLTLGSPDGGTVNYIFDMHHLRVDNTALYAHDGIAATASLLTDCSDIYPNVWRTPVYVWLQDGESLGVTNVAYPIYLRALRTSYHQMRTSLC